MKAFEGLHFGAGTAFYKASGDKARVLEEAVLQALGAGFSVIDNAQMYENEAVVGRALQRWLADPSHARDEIRVVSKVSPGSDIRKECERSLRELQVDYLDLYLIHSPFHDEPLSTMWKAMESLVDDGKVRHIGVSNFRQSDLEAILADARIRPVNNQIELHAYCFDKEWPSMSLGHGPRP